MKRHYPEQPILGVGGILFQNEEVLLVKRGTEPARGQWSIPGGVVDTGETLRDAVIREVAEETGIEAEPVALVKILDRIFRDPVGMVAYHYVLVDFLCRFKAGEVHPGTDALEARFFPVADLASLEVIPVTREVIEQAFRYLKACGAPEKSRNVAAIYDSI